MGYVLYCVLYGERVSERAQSKHFKPFLYTLYTLIRSRGMYCIILNLKRGDATVVSFEVGSNFAFYPCFISARVCVRF